MANITVLHIIAVQRVLLVPFCETLTIAVYNIIFVDFFSFHLSVFENFPSLAAHLWCERNCPYNWVPIPDFVVVRTPSIANLNFRTTHQTLLLNVGAC